MLSSQYTVTRYFMSFTDEEIGCTAHCYFVYSTSLRPHLLARKLFYKLHSYMLGRANSGLRTIHLTCVIFGSVNI